MGRKVKTPASHTAGPFRRPTHKSAIRIALLAPRRQKHIVKLTCSKRDLVNYDTKRTSTSQTHRKLEVFTQVGPKMAPTCPKMAQDGPKRARDGPRWPQEGPRWPQVGPKMAPRWHKMAPGGAKMTQDGPKRPQDGPKMAPRWPKMAPRWPQDGPKLDPPRRQKH